VCWQNKHILSMYPYVLGLYWYVPRMNEYIQEYYLWSLTRCVIWVSPQHNLLDLTIQEYSVVHRGSSLWVLTTYFWFLGTWWYIQRNESHNPVLYQYIPCYSMILT
jgi:hypothetical protein